MEAPLHQSLVPLPPLPQDPAAIAAATLAMVAAAQNPPPATMMGREQCPRCASRDTKFCYYNNYNTSQPRHFCRACRRYWTLGGSLRNVPIGGSTRKRPRPTRRAFTAAAAATTLGRRFTTSSSSPVAPRQGLQGLQVMGHSLLGSLLLGLGAAPLLEGRLGCSDLGGLGQQPALLAAGAAGLAHQEQLGFGAEQLLWPAATTTTVLEGDRALPLQVTPDAVLWHELAAPPVESGGLHQSGSTHLLL